jgi:hypothetical protein
MKPLSTIALFFAAVLVFIGVASRDGAGTVLSNAVIVGGVIIAVTVFGIWIGLFLKNRGRQ